MILLDKNKLIADPGRHWASENYIRIQVLKIEATETDYLFDRYKGELLILVLEGQIYAKTEDNKALVDEGNQVLFTNGQAFAVYNSGKFQKSIIQFNWMPGPYGK